MRAVIQIKRCLLASNKYPLLQEISEHIYQLAIRVFVLLISREKRVKAIYLRNSLAVGNWLTWDSDIDLTIVLAETRLKDIYRLLVDINRKLRLVRVVFPVLGHVDIFQESQFDKLLSTPQPELSYFTRSLRQIYGPQGRQRIPISDRSEGCLFRVSDFEQILKWLYSDKSPGTNIYLRQYRNFFKKVLNTETQVTNAHKSLQTRISQIGSPCCPSNQTTGILSCALHDSLRILGAIHDRLGRSDETASSLTYVDHNKEQTVCKTREKADALGQKLIATTQGIKSIFITTPSIINTRHKLWVVLDEEREDVTCNALRTIQNNYSSTADTDIIPYLITERALKLFLATDRTLPFEYFHMQHHSLLIAGDNILPRLTRPSDSRLWRAAQSNVVVYTNMAYNLMLNAPNVFLWIMSLRLFFEKQLLLSTKHTTLGVYKETYDTRHFMALETAVYGRRAPQKALFTELISLLFTLSQIGIGGGD